MAWENLKKYVPLTFVSVILVAAGLYDRLLIDFGSEIFAVITYICIYAVVADKDRFLRTISYIVYPVCGIFLVYTLSRTGYLDTGIWTFDLWISARFVETVVFVLALCVFVKKTRSRKRSIFRSLYPVLIIASAVFMVFEITAGSDSGNDFFKMMYSLIHFAYIISILKITYKKAPSFLIYFLFKTAGDLAGMFSYHSNDIVFTVSAAVRIISYILLYRAASGRRTWGDNEEHVTLADHYARVFQNIRVGIIMLRFTKDENSVVIKDANRYAMKYLELDNETVIGDGRDIRELKGAVFDAVMAAKDSLLIGKSSVRIIKTDIDGRMRYIKTRFFPCQGKMVCVMFEDITQSIDKEKKINELVRYDHLTKLYNRNITPEIEKMLDKSSVYPVAVIVGDVNGLKATNDIFGHFEGDRLLKEVASIMMNTIDPGDFCMRYGGDEFLIVSFNCSLEKAKELIEFLNLRLAGSRALDFPLSVSFGYSIMEKRQELDAHIEKADRMMYEIKNEDEMKTRRNILESLLRTFKFQNIESREHLENVARISKLIGQRLGLPDTELSELSLIASLHDIGMINVALDVLKKQGQLTEDEWETIKKHASDGYNMTDAIKEFKGVSKYILFHHEQWDGGGYPYGLKGESIPILSRITAVADAFDSMTRERPYRKKLDKDAALWEIKSNSGRQFDPSIVSLLLEMRDIL